MLNELKTRTCGYFTGKGKGREERRRKGRGGREGVWSSTLAPVRSSYLYAPPRVIVVLLNPMHF